MDTHYNEVLAAQRALPGALDPGYTAKHAALVSKIRALVQAVEREGIFSTNEEQDDIATNSLRFLSLWFFMGQALDTSRVDPASDQVTGRMLVLQAAIRSYLNFCGILQDYQLLPPPLAQFYRRVASGAQFDLTKSPPGSRETKIQIYSLGRSAQELWRELQAQIGDEEAQREAYFAKLGFEAIEAWKAIASNAQELELLAGMAGVSREDALREGRIQPREATFADSKARDTSTRVDPDQRPRGPLTGPKGKVLRPFTLTRQAARQTVMGTGQVLPSMTVEEFVDQELRNGGMVKPKEEEVEDDEDDMEFQDRETLRLRRWDEFTEANPKGSGNTMNLG